MSTVLAGRRPGYLQYADDVPGVGYFEIRETEGREQPFALWGPTGRKPLFDGHREMCVYRFFLSYRAAFEYFTNYTGHRA
jgi:hypothetical protein